MTIRQFPLHLRGVQTVPMLKGAMPLSVAYLGCLSSPGSCWC